MNLFESCLKWCSAINIASHSFCCRKTWTCVLTEKNEWFVGDFYNKAEDQEGVMDNLLEALKDGSAFNVNRERKDGRKRTPRAAGG